MPIERRFEGHPQSADGDFYVVNHDCTSCGAPHEVADDLIGWSDAEMGHCIWKKQPETPEELERAFVAFDACCLGCYRYAGNDPAIMARIGLEFCDQAIATPAQPEQDAIADALPIEVQFTLAAGKHASQSSWWRRAYGKLASIFKRP